MSEDSKMGLFGSKDKNQGQKESSKDNSPVRYTPYCIDSDTETYDTEALSMMDINDIIGVQSEQVDDSTLESEMDALSRMITDSKVESTQQSFDPKSEMQQELSEITSSPFDAAIDIDNTAGVSNIKQSDIADTIVGTHRETAEHKSVIDKGKSEAESAKTKSREYDEVSEKDTKITDDTFPVSIFQSISGNIGVASSSTKATDTLQRSDNTSSLSFGKDITTKTLDQSTRDTVESKDKILESTSDSRSVVTVGSISKSLQLIGEAYISDDSEETNMNDTNSSQENTSFCASGETSLFNISIQQEESKDDPDVSEQNQKESVNLNDVNNVTDSTRLNVETENVDDRTEDLIQNMKMIEPKISSQDETLEIQECIDSSTVNNTPTCIDNEIDKHESREENNMEIDKTEKILSETQSCSEISTETTEKSISVRASKEITEFIEDGQESKIEDVESTVVPKMEEQNSLIASNENELPDKAKKVETVSDIKEITQCQNEDIFVKSVSNAQQSPLIEVSNEKSNISESNKDNLQAVNNIIESSPETQKTVEMIDTLDSESSEACNSQVVNIETVTMISNPDENVDLNKDVETTSVLIDKNICKTKSDTTSSLLNLNEDTVSSIRSGVKDSSLNEENVTSDLDSIDFIIKNDTCQTSDANKCEDTIIQTEEDICTKATKSSVPVEYNQSISSEKYETDESSNVTSINPKDLHSTTISESSNTDSNIEAPAEVKEIKHMDTDISETISPIPHEDKSETFTRDLLKQELNQPEVNTENRKSAACIVHEKNTSDSESIMPSDTNISSPDHSIIPETDVINILCDTKLDVDKAEESIINETLPSEEIITKSDKYAKERNSEISSISEKVPTSDARPTDVQDNRDMCNENTEILETQLISENITLMIEKKNMVPTADTSIDDNLIKGSSANIPILHETSEAILDKQDKDICDDAKRVSEAEKNVLQDSTSTSSETNIERLAKGLSEDLEDIDDATQNVDSLEGLLNLDVISSDTNSSSKLPEARTSKTQVEEINKDISMDSLLDRTDQSETIMTQNSDYLTNVITDCLAGRDIETNYPDINISDKIAIETSESVKINEDTSEESINEGADHERMDESLQRDNILQQNDLDISFVSDRLESVEDLGDSESKLDLAQDILLSAGESMNDTPIAIENSQSSSEISELESAVKFLQESEEQTIDSPLVLSPKIVESVVEDITTQANVELYAADEADNYVNAPELIPDLRHVGADSISISEAEIITEAAKLENERKFAAQMKKESNHDKKEITNEEISNKIEDNQICSNVPSDSITDSNIHSATDTQTSERVHAQKEESIPDIRPLSSEGILKACELIRRSSILEERLKEPPKIEIPLLDPAKICDISISPHDSLLIPKDARAAMYSPKSIDKIESSKVVETARKDSDKHDFENVGSPRIILKIAKSAITDCSEPRSPKSPKIRSTTNSPNPEDSPGQKLGKIKLKLSKGGHPSIISNENLEEASQWHTDSTSSLSPLGMKIKLSKSGDASIITGDKYENLDDSKETKHKFEESKRTDSPIGMKIKLSKSGDASIIQQDYKEVLTKHKEKQEIPHESPKRIESPIGMKFKLSKSGDASIIQTDRQDCSEECKETGSKRTDSPIGMKFKLSKSGDASIISPDISDDIKDSLKMKERQEVHPRTESPVKIKLSKCKGGASIIPMDNSDDIRDKLDIPDPPKRTGSPLGMKIKLSKTGNVSIMHSETMVDTKEARYKEKSEVGQDIAESPESTAIKAKMLKSDETSTLSSIITEEKNISHGFASSIGMKIKVSKPEDTSITSDKIEPTEDFRPWEVQTDVRRTESPIGMKIKFSRGGDASIVHSETAEDHQNQTVRVSDAECSKGESSLGMKIKLSKTGDASVVEIERKDKQQKRKDMESPLEMKIKLSKTGHPTIISCDNSSESVHKTKDPLDPSTLALSHKYKEQHASTHKESTLKIVKSGNSTILQSNRSELTIEPVQMQSMIETSSKRKEMIVSPVECKKSKLEAQLSQILPEVTIQPVMCRDQKQLLFDPKTSLISRQQMNVINQEISITQVRPTKTVETSISEKLKEMLCKNAAKSAADSDCEIIEHRPELIIVNENSNSSQDVMIIEEMPPNRMAEIKVPKKRGRPRRNPLIQQPVHSAQMMIPRDPLALDEIRQMQPFEQRENERPKRTCRSQKSYAPPRRGRGRGRGKRKLDSVDIFGKKPRVDQDLSAIEASTTAVITIGETTMQQQQDALRQSSELYKALKQPPMDRKSMSSICKVGKHSILMNRQETGKDSALIMQLDPNRLPYMQEDPSKSCLVQTSTDSALLGSNDADKQTSVEIISEQTQKMAVEQHTENSDVNKILDVPRSNATEIKEMPVPPGHSNWLTPISKKQTDAPIKGETVSTVQVIDEETRMSAESNSRSQTPARNMSAPASETIINEESQGSVLSTATTESEKVKVKNRRMEINFDPDEGPFTVDKIAEYEWPLDRKGETFMIQEQISQYLGVKSFKRKYPDLKRRMVDMEERNYLRENGLVSEAMCDMGLTAVCSSEVLDVMCSDFPDQYEEYRKHMREKQVKEHSKKQKELTAAANAEKNRIDLAEMAVQSALSWNINLNKARKETRKCCLDLQTFTIHVPKKQQKVDTEHKISHYPVALIAGQYTDYYREYTAAELRYYPLNTVLYGPTRPNERKFDSQSEGSQSDSDSESSSDDSSSSSSEGTQDTEGSQSTMDDVDMEIVTQKDDVKLKCKMCLKVLNKHSKNEILIQCGTCNGNVHPSCIDITLDMVPHIQSYAWQCTDCKTCAQCHDPADEDKMLFCDMCDRGYHIYCVGLRRVPQGRWHCQECAICANCGSREPGGANSDRNSVAQWQHEYKKGEKNTRVYISTLCIPCSKLWRKGRYCPHCSRCHTAQRLDLEANLVHCSACDKYLHLDCVETKGIVVDKKNYLCDFCTPSNRHQVTKSLFSKMLKM